jgi:2,2-dialkylglycine decarboxylase (pyruvate)
MTAKELGDAVVEKTFAGGLSCSVVPSPAKGSVIRLVPPITISSEEIHQALQILDQTLAAVLVQ